MKKRYVISLLLDMLLTMTSCFKRDSLEDVDIYTTVYPIEFVTDYLYGYNSRVSSIYPAEVDLDKYALTEKQINKYSKGAIFVYNGLTNEKSIARDLLNSNNDLKIIDVSQGLDYVNSTVELWMNPGDFLMLSYNIKNGLEEYINNNSIIEEIEKNYESLKVLISTYDAELEMIPDNTDDKTIVIANSSLNFLSKYGFDVIDIDTSKAEVSSTIKTKVEKLIKAKTLKYIYMLDTDIESDVVKDFVKKGAKVKILRSMTVKTEEDLKNGVTYKNMMRDNIDAIKEEVYSN